MWPLDIGSLMDLAFASREESDTVLSELHRWRLSRLSTQCKGFAAAGFAILLATAGAILQGAVFDPWAAGVMTGCAVLLLFTAWLLNYSISAVESEYLVSAKLLGAIRQVFGI